MIIDRPRIAVATAGFCAFLNLYSPQAVLPQLAASYGVSTAAAGYDCAEFWVPEGRDATDHAAALVLGGEAHAERVLGLEDCV